MPPEFDIFVYMLVTYSGNFNEVHGGGNSPIEHFTATVAVLFAGCGEFLGQVTVNDKNDLI